MHTRSLHCDMHLSACVGQLKEHPGTKIFRVVRVGHQRQCLGRYRSERPGKVIVKY
jgi:hypothetical protein